MKYIRNVLTSSYRTKSLVRRHREFPDDNLYQVKLKSLFQYDNVKTYFRSFVCGNYDILNILITFFIIVVLTSNLSSIPRLRLLRFDRSSLDSGASSPPFRGRDSRAGALELVAL